MYNTFYSVVQRIFKLTFNDQIIMAIKYRVAEKQSLKKEKDGSITRTPVRVAIQASRGRIPVEDVARRIEKETALGFGDVLSVLATLGPVVAEYAGLGFSVDLDRFGTFTPRISAKAISDPEKAYTADLIKGTKIRFTPAVDLRESTKRFSYEVVESGTKEPAGTTSTDTTTGTDTGGTSNQGGL